MPPRVTTSRVFRSTEISNKSDAKQRPPEGNGNHAMTQYSNDEIDGRDVAFATPPHLDHVFLTVGAEALKLINECEFLRDEQFSRFATRSSESSLLSSYTATRAYGKNTVVEIFQDRFGGNDTFNEHCAGIVLSFDHPGEMKEAHRALHSAGLPFSSEIVERVTPRADGGRDRSPWYEFTRPELGGISPIALFLHEMQPGFLAEIGAKVGPGGRQDRSERFDAALGRLHTADHLMEDVSLVTVRLRPGRIERASAVLSTLGYDVSAMDSGIRVRGTDAEFIFLADESPREGTVELKIKMARPVPGRRFDFGSESSLVLSPAGPDDCSASWTFLPHRKAL